MRTLHDETWAVVSLAALLMAVFWPPTLSASFRA